MKGMHTTSVSRHYAHRILLFRLLANLMLPDGAERQPADWTVFFLNQTPFNTIKPVLSWDNEDGGEAVEEDARMLYVINLVRTKLDKTARR